MTKDCQCHRLFYPTLVSSRSSNFVNSLKAKTTISPVITTLRTIAVIQRKKRKNEDLLLRSKLSKSSYIVNQLDSQPGPIVKRSFPQDLFEYDYLQFKQSLLSSPEPQPVHKGSNRFFGLDHDALRLKQDKLTNPVANQTELWQASSSSNTCTNIQSDYDRRNNRYRNLDSSSYTGKENYEGSWKQSFEASNWKGRPTIPGKLGLLLNPSYSPKIGTSEYRDQLIFNMSPFSFTQTLSTFMSSSANHLHNRNSVKGLDRRKIKSDHLAEESDDDEDESLISITSVLPIDIIPQSHKSS